MHSEKKEKIKVVIKLIIARQKNSIPNSTKQALSCKLWLILSVVGSQQIDNQTNNTSGGRWWLGGEERGKEMNPPLWTPRVQCLLR